MLFPGQAMGNRLPELQGFDENGNPGYGFDTIRYWGFQDADFRGLSWLGLPTWSESYGASGVAALSIARP